MGGREREERPRAHTTSRAPKPPRQAPNTHTHTQQRKMSAQSHQPTGAAKAKSSGIRRRGRGVSMRCRGSCLLLLSSSPSSRGPRAIKRSWGEGNDEQKEGASNGEEEARRETSSSLLAGQDMVILEEARVRVTDVPVDLRPSTFELTLLRSAD